MSEDKYFVAVYDFIETKEKFEIKDAIVASISGEETFLAQYDSIIMSVISRDSLNKIFTMQGLDMSYLLDYTALYTSEDIEEGLVKSKKIVRYSFSEEIIQQIKNLDPQYIKGVFKFYESPIANKSRVMQHTTNNKFCLKGSELLEDIDNFIVNARENSKKKSMKLRLLRNCKNTQLDLIKTPDIILEKINETSTSIIKKDDDNNSSEYILGSSNVRKNQDDENSSLMGPLFNMGSTEYKRNMDDDSLLNLIESSKKDSEDLNNISLKNLLYETEDKKESINIKNNNLRNAIHSVELNNKTKENKEKELFRMKNKDISPIKSKPDSNPVLISNNNNNKIEIKSDKEISSSPTANRIFHIKTKNFNPKKLQKKEDQKVDIKGSVSSISNNISGNDSQISSLRNSFHTNNTNNTNPKNIKKEKEDEEEQILYIKNMILNFSPKPVKEEDVLNEPQTKVENIKQNKDETIKGKEVKKRTIRRHFSKKIDRYKESTDELTSTLNQISETSKTKNNDNKTVNENHKYEELTNQFNKNINEYNKPNEFNKDKEYNIINLLSKDKENIKTKEILKDKEHETLNLNKDNEYDMKKVLNKNKEFNISNGYNDKEYIITNDFNTPKQYNKNFQYARFNMNKINEEDEDEKINDEDEESNSKFNTSDFKKTNKLNRNDTLRMSNDDNSLLQSSELKNSQEYDSRMDSRFDSKNDSKKTSIKAKDSIKVLLNTNKKIKHQVQMVNNDEKSLDERVILLPDDKPFMSENRMKVEDDKMIMTDEKLNSMTPEKRMVSNEKLMTTDNKLSTEDKLITDDKLRSGHNNMTDDKRMSEGKSMTEGKLIITEEKKNMSDDKNIQSDEKLNSEEIVRTNQKHTSEEKEINEKKQITIDNKPKKQLIISEKEIIINDNDNDNDNDNKDIKLRAINNNSKIKRPKEEGSSNKYIIRTTTKYDEVKRLNFENMKNNKENEIYSNSKDIKNNPPYNSKYITLKDYIIENENNHHDNANCLVITSEEIEPEIIKLAEGGSVNEEIEVTDENTQKKIKIKPENILPEFIYEYYMDHIYPNEKRYKEIKKKETGETFYKQIPHNTQSNKNKMKKNEKFLKLFDTSNPEVYYTEESLEDKENIIRNINNQIRGFDNNISDKDFNYLQHFCIKICLLQKLQFNKNHNIFSEKLINIYDLDLEQYALIKDKVNFYHFVLVDEINKENLNKCLYDVETNKQFIPNEQDIVYFDPNNELEQYYKLENSKGETIFVSYPFLKDTINCLEHQQKLGTLTKVYDFAGNEQTINKHEAMRLLNLTKFNRVLKSREYVDDVYIMAELINGQIKEIPINKIVKLQKDLIEGKTINKFFRFINPYGEEELINPYQMRPYNNSQFLRDIKEIPYEEVKYRLNSYYKVSNLKQKKKEFLTRKEIEEIINRKSLLGYEDMSCLSFNLSCIKDFSKTEDENSLRNRLDPNDYYLDELKTALNKNNEAYSYIKFNNDNGNEILVPKMLVYKYIASLCNNEEIPRFIKYSDFNIDLKQNLLKHFKIKNNPFTLDDILRQPSNTYTEYEINEPIDYSKHSASERIPLKFPGKINENNDMYELIKIKDINDNEVMVNKSMIRKIISKRTLLENDNFIDSARNKRIIAPYEVMAGNRLIYINTKDLINTKDKIKDTNLLEKIENNIYIDVDDNFVTKKFFNKIKGQLDEKKEESQMEKAIVFYDEIKKKKCKVPMENFKNINEYNQWVLIKDVQDFDCIINKRVLLCMINLNSQHFQRKWEIVDYYKRRRMIRLDKVINYFQQKDESILSTASKMINILFSH